METKHSHIILRNPRLNGWEYGVHNALENEIIFQTGAKIIDVPSYGISTELMRTGHGMRFESARKFLPKKKLKIQADVIWYILMGPENYELDLFKYWDIQAKYKIIYLFDTLEHQFPLLEKLLRRSKFNVHITSFADGVSHLEAITRQKWHAIEQAVPLGLFHNVQSEKRIIDFSSYGRRLEGFHEILLDFCKSNQLYYDYTTQLSRQITVSADAIYKQYAWHLNHSLFTVSWPVELTNPVRAGRLHPITCRWFEAAAAGTIILGKKPNNEMFDKVLAPGLVHEINPNENKKTIWVELEKLYINRDKLLSTASQLQQDNKLRWLWSERVARILRFLPYGHNLQ